MENLIKFKSNIEHDEILKKLSGIYWDLFNHTGYGTIKIYMRFLKKDQKEIVINYGKDFRYVVDFNEDESLNKI